MNSNAFSMKPPLQPWLSLLTSQSTRACSDRENNFPFFILLIPSIDATAEKAQQLPTIEALDKIVHTTLSLVFYWSYCTFLAPIYFLWQITMMVISKCPIMYRIVFRSLEPQIHGLELLIRQVCILIVC